MKKLIKMLLNMLGIDIRRAKAKREQTVVSLKTTLPSQGNILLAYILDPFLLNKGEEVSHAHTHHFESKLLAQSYLELGYDVDVISYLDRDFVPKKKYAFYINARENFVHLAKQLDGSCIKIVHLDTAHFLFNNFAAHKRSLELQRRRGVTLVGRTIFAPNRAIENCDYATILGNKFTIDTYDYVNKPIFPLPVPTPHLFDFPNNKKFDSCRRSFLWFGSSGFVHKGLDLVLEAFSRLPEFSLTVCGPLEREPYFVEAYHQELYQTANINTIGWVDIKSREFLKIINNCVGLIYPSCAEGQAGAVITCMQAGLIPIISYESGVDVDDHGILLKECSVNEIIKSVTALSGRSTPDLMAMAEKAQAFCRAKHVGKNYIEENKKIINLIHVMESEKKSS